MFCREAAHRVELHNRIVLVLEEGLAYQILKIVLAHLAAKLVKKPRKAKVQAGIRVVNPALKALQAVDQSLRRRAEVCLARAELRHVDGGEQHLVIQAVLRNLREQLANTPQKAVFLLTSQMLRRNLEIGLSYAVCVAAVNIVPEALLNEGIV